jgi:hypothetical protein
MADDFRIQRYCAADRDGVLDLMRVAFSEDFAARLCRQWDWKYGSHPLNREAAQTRRTIRETLWPYIVKTYSAETLAQWGVSSEPLEPLLPDDAPYVLLLKDRDKVIAVEGALPQAFLINGRRQLVFVFCDLAVHPDYRGHALSMRLTMRMASEHGLTMSWTNLTARAVGFRWLKRASRQRPLDSTSKWGSMRVVTLVKPIDWKYTTRRLTGIGQLGSVAAMVSAGAHRMRSTFGKPPPASTVDIVKAECFDDRFAHLWNRCSPAHEVIAVRDPTYLNWRFAARPDASYICLAAVRGSIVVGYLVYRLVEREGALWGYVVDFLCDGGDATSVFKSLLTRAEELMIAAGAQSLICVIAREPFRSVLRRAGFYPAVFGSLSFLGGSVTSLDPQLNVYAAVNKWFVTVGDGDAELSF